MTTSFPNAKIEILSYDTMVYHLLKPLETVLMKMTQSMQLLSMDFHIVIHFYYNFVFMRLHFAVTNSPAFVNLAKTAATDSIKN